MHTRHLTLSLIIVALIISCNQSQSFDYDLVIRGGTVFDGSGAPGAVGDVGVRGDRIVAVGDVNGTGVRTIDASGLYVTPGFIDMHSHSETFRLLNGGQGPSFAFQGFTTEIYGETVSMGPLGGQRRNELPDELLGKWESFGEFLDYMEEVGISINVASYVGSGGIRANVMGYDDRPPTLDELEQMLELVRKSMREGALGVSAGMSYVPNIYMTSDELASIVREAANMGGIFANHARTMNGTDPDAIREAIAIGEQAGAAIHFFHLNSTSSTEADTFLAIIDEARERGLKVTGDSYTYTWGITGLRAYIPAWAQAGGVDAMLESACAIRWHANASLPDLSPSLPTWRTSAGITFGWGSIIRISTASWYLKLRDSLSKHQKKFSWMWFSNRKVVELSSTGTMKRTHYGKSWLNPTSPGEPMAVPSISIPRICLRLCTRGTLERSHGCWAHMFENRDC